MNEYAKIIRLCTKSSAFFDERPYQNTNILQVVHYSWLLKNFQLQDYKRCRQIAVGYQAVFQIGSYNWFQWNELYVLAELHAGRYEAAADLWERVADQPEYDALPAGNLEFWEITGSYLYLLVQCGKLKEKKTNQKFRIAKASSGIALIQPDESRLGAPLLGLQFLLALADRDYERCMVIRDTLAQYRTRYRQKTARSSYFFQMLEQIPAASFSQKEAIRKATSWVQKLQTCEKQHLATEIIPCEILWTYALELLNRNEPLDPLLHPEDGTVLPG